MLIKLRDESGEVDGERICYFLFDDNLKPFPAKFVLPGAYALDTSGNILK